MRVVFFGTPEFSADFLRALIADGDFDIVAVVTQQDELQGRKKELTPPPTKLVALEHNIPVLQPTKLKDSAFADALTALNARRVRGHCIRPHYSASRSRHPTARLRQRPPVAFATPPRAVADYFRNREWR